MKRILHITPRLLATLPLLGLAMACGGGGGGGDTTVAASSTQVGQAVLVASAAIDGATAATDTAAGVVGTSSVASASVGAAAMDMGGVMGAGHFTGMGPGKGSLDLEPVTCGESGTVGAHMQWSGLDTATLCADGLTANLDLSQCAPTADQSMTGMMRMDFAGNSCDPTTITMDFSGATVTIPDGTLSGNFTMAMTGMMFVGDPTALDISGATVTFDGPMHMAGSGFGTIDMDMDHLAFHYDDAAHTGDLNGTLTVHCNGEAFPMTMATDADGLSLDADGNVVAGHMTVTSQGTTHQVTFNADGSIDVTPAAGEPVHLAAPAAGDFCALTAG